MTDNLTTYFPSFVSQFGIGNDLFGIILTIAIYLGLFIAIYKFTGYFIYGMISGGIAITFSAFYFHFIPVWIALIYILLCGYYLAYWIFFSVPKDSTTETEPITGQSQWDIYGQQLKDAYTAKFGGQNTGFNSEVDKRISIMNHNGKGFTRSLAYDWLKRMNRFTESK